MPRISKSLEETAFLTAALEGLELQKARVQAQIEQVRTMLGGSKVNARQVTVAPATKRQLSPAARKRIAAAQKRRWAEFRKQNAAASK
ncbi:MAG: hypothetical protein M1541_00585 [Acidobacteria bacterium]|nr:hypothetical protein [Acidobacteriota bacterium]